MNTATGKPAMRPLDWMELEREYAQYDERSRAVLNAALDECRAQQDATALALCRLCCADTDLLFAIIDFVRRNHPAGRLSDAGPNSRTSLAVRKALAEALARLVEGDVARAEQYLRTGIDNMLYAAGAERAESNVDVQRLENLADQIAATRSAQTTAAPAVQYAVTVD
ncbi:MAG: hypothetical protein H6817_06150 [Phycisphaerales bacterium]|nr:hypothetical protein [Phycisphaerales bacterium]